MDRPHVGFPKHSDNTILNWTTSNDFFVPYLPLPFEKYH